MSGGTELLPERHRSRKLDLNDEFSICPYCGKYLLFPCKDSIYFLMLSLHGLLRKMRESEKSLTLN